VNYSNVDYPVIGHPDNTGITRVLKQRAGGVVVGRAKGVSTVDANVDYNSSSWNDRLRS
jgi:hypothetical protein